VDQQHPRQSCARYSKGFFVHVRLAAGAPNYTVVHSDRVIIPAVRQVLQLRRVFLTVLFIGLFAMAARNVLDPDVWWHLETGEWIVQHRAVPHADPFSFTRAGQPWIAHEWLSELLIYGVYRIAGMGGLIGAFALILCAALLVLFYRCGSHFFVAGAIVVCGAWATAPLWGVRPQILSFLLASLWLLILERSESKHELIWWTLPLTILWVNLHAGFAIGPALIVLFLTGELIERFLTPRPGHNGPRLRTLVITLLFTLLLVPLNPNGTKMFWYPVQTLLSKPMQGYISEWASPNFHSADYWPLLLLVLALVAILGWSGTRVRPRDLFLLSATTFAALSSIRLIPLFVLVAVPILARPLQPWFSRSYSPSRPRKLVFAIANAAVILAMVAFTAAHTAQVIRRQPQAEAEHFPVAAVAYLEAHPGSGPIFNHYDWGGYLIFRLYPGTHVFIDGRADLYGEHLMEQFVDGYYLMDDWQQPLAQWRITTAIVTPNSALAAALRQAPGWTSRYEDSQAIIFSK
jgi:hypothetical protein